MRSALNPKQFCPTGQETQRAMREKICRAPSCAAENPDRGDLAPADADFFGIVDPPSVSAIVIDCFASL
jgi:hypothetical protein